jgi:phytoene dehydrogenase-like protein
VLGGMPRLVWGAIATGVGVAALALIVAPAHATTDRVDYSDQANPICISANKQTVQVYESVEAETERLEGLHPKNRKKARRIRKRAERLYDQLPFQFLAIYRAELEQLKAIAPPPGYEDTVARWLGAREQISALYEQYLQIENALDSIEFAGKSRKAMKRALKRERKLERLEDQNDDQLLVAFEVDLELGTKMGAAYCVTGADGEITPTVVFSGD